jgi:murein L,D-transpeptidase YcbB/YkuD
MDILSLLPLLLSLLASGGKWVPIVEKVVALIHDILALSQGGTDAAPAPVKMDIRWVQQSLKTLGYDPGPVDGTMGSRTASAVKDFQKANGLEADGWVGVMTQAKLAQLVGSS